MGETPAPIQSKDGMLSAWEMLEIAVSGANGSEEVDLVSLARNAAAEARAMADALRQGLPMHGSTNPDAIKPVAWMHRLNMELGQFAIEITCDADHPFGELGEDFDPSYTVTTVRLYSSEQMEAEKARGDALEAMLAEAAKVLEPFAASSEEHTGHPRPHDGDCIRGMGPDWLIGYGHLRAARALLLKLQDHPDE